MMLPLLSDYMFSPVLRYESHRLIYTPADHEPAEAGGFFGAAFLAVLLADTEEGDSRGIELDTEAQQDAFFDRYDREVRRDDWGYLAAELSQLRDTYVNFSLPPAVPFADICPNNRLFDLAIRLIVRYMRRLTIEVYCEHIWDYCPFTEPFPQWLWSAMHAEPLRRRYLQTDWTDIEQVCCLADSKPTEEEPVFFFEGEAADEIMRRYLDWLTALYTAQLNEQPAVKINLTRHRQYIVKNEIDTSFLSDEIGTFSDFQRAQWDKWMAAWETFIRAQLGQPKEVLFWADHVSDFQKEHLLYRLRLQERKPNHFRDLTTTVYAMRYLGIIRRGCSIAHIKQWLAENLDIDYTARNNSSQFTRAWKEHGRYTPEIRSEVTYLRTIME